jgi:xanthine dehydrogenase YagR molybdenum-binding subunit
VVAETLEQAQHAASLVRVLYEEKPAKLDFVAGFPSSYPGSHTGIPGDMSWGEVQVGLDEAEIKIDQLYTTPMQHHNPIEPHATIAQWQEGELTVHDATQHISGVQETLSRVFGLAKERCT